MKSLIAGFIISELALKYELGLELEITLTTLAGIL